MPTMRKYLLSSLAAFSLAAQNASLRGVAVDSVTGLPIPRAHVTLRSGAGNNQRLYGSLTGPDGAFSLENITPGEYDAYAERTGYVGPRTDTHLTLQTGDSKTGYTLKLTPTGGIAGHVLDSSGEPVSGAQVTADADPQARRAATTDDTGQFRIGGLPPGRYRVKANPNRSHASPEIRTDRTEDVNHATTTFPSRVEVRPGVDSAGVEIRLRRIPFVRVSGRVTGIPAGVEHNYVNAQEGPDVSSSAAIASDGTFQIWLDPGKYRLRAHAANGMISAPMEIEVAGANLDNLELHLMPLVSVAGTLEFDDDQVKHPRQVITLSEYGTGARAGSSTIADDRTFEFPDVPVGRYRVNITSEAAYVKSVRLGSQVADGSLIDILGIDPGDLSVHLSTATGTVSGTVTDSSGPAKRIKVTLIGSDPCIHNRSILTGPDGSYTFTSVPPGSWTVTAGEPSNDSAGETFDIHPNDRITKDLKADPAT